MARGLRFSRTKVRSLLKKAAKSRGRGVKIPALPKGMNANESRFKRQILGGRGKYEPIKITITRRNERKYTPDFVYLCENLTKMAIIEVKGSYKLQSEERARLAWEIAAENDNMMATFVWARYSRGGYECEAWFDSGRRMVKRRITTNAEFEQLLLEDGK